MSSEIQIANPRLLLRSTARAAWMLVGLFLAFMPERSGAVTFADVTTRGFSAVWASSEPVSSATVRVFADAAATTEITPSLAIGAASAGGPPNALPLGVVRVKVSGLTPGVCVFVQTETTASATVLDPPIAPFPSVCTSAGASKQTPGGAPILNDLVSHDLLAPNQQTADGALLLVRVRGISRDPISVFAGEGYASPHAVVDLNNVIDASTGTHAEVPGGDAVELVEFRGLLCPGLSDHELVRFRRAPAHEEVGTIGARLIELEPLEQCFAEDTVCDDVVNILDLQHTLNGLGAIWGECRFNPDLDLDASGVIDAADVQRVIEEFGATAPFPGP